MSKPAKKQGLRDFIRSVSQPNLSSREIEVRRCEWLTPGTFANWKSLKDGSRSLRERVLTLPVMVALVLSLVYRQVRYLAEIVRELE